MDSKRNRNVTKKHSSSSSSWLNVSKFVEFDDLPDSKIRTLLKNTNLKGLVVYAKAKLRPHEKELVKKEISRRLDYMDGVDMYNISTLQELKIVQDDATLSSKITKIYNAMIEGNRSYKKARNNAGYAIQENFLRSHFSHLNEPPSEPVALNHASNGSGTNSNGSNSNNGKMQRFLKRSRRAASRNRRAYARAANSTRANSARANAARANAARIRAALLANATRANAAPVSRFQQLVRSRGSPTSIPKTYSERMALASAGRSRTGSMGRPVSAKNVPNYKWK
jgi:hypothetical protein